MEPGPPLNPDAADFVRRQLAAERMGGPGLQVGRLPADPARAT